MTRAELTNVSYTIERFKFAGVKHLLCYRPHHRHAVAAEREDASPCFDGRRGAAPARPSRRDGTPGPRPGRVGPDHRADGRVGPGHRADGRVGPGHQSGLSPSRTVPLGGARARVESAGAIWPQSSVARLGIVWPPVEASVCLSNSLCARFEHLRARNKQFLACIRQDNLG